MHTDHEKQCRFFIVPGGGPVLLDMLDVEMLELPKCKLQHNRAKLEEWSYQ